MVNVLRLVPTAPGHSSASERLKQEEDRGVVDVGIQLIAVDTDTRTCYLL